VYFFLYDSLAGFNVDVVVVVVVVGREKGKKTR
jgi:hypothetical protein